MTRTAPRCEAGCAGSSATAPSTAFAGPRAGSGSDQSVDALTSLCSSADVVSDVLQREEARSVGAAVLALPAAQREAIELAYYGGYSQTEIAALTAAPLGTVKGRTRLAMRALAAALAPLRPTDVGLTGVGVRALPTIAANAGGADH